MSSANLMRLKPIKDYFKSKFIAVSDQWIANQLNLNSNASNESIYQLWLNSDIRKISPTDDSSVLPKDCNRLKVNEFMRKADKTILYGRHAVQINSIEDISRPLVLTDGPEEQDSSDDSSGTETENNLFKKRKVSKPKTMATKRGSRMLSMALTDGHTECKAVEYQPISCLSIDTPIGTKLVISGPLDIYAAVMLLRDKNVTILGGSLPLDARDQPLRPVTHQTN